MHHNVAITGASSSEMTQVFGGPSARNASLRAQYGASPRGLTVPQWGSPSRISTTGQELKLPK